MIAQRRVYLFLRGGDSRDAYLYGVKEREREKARKPRTKRDDDTSPCVSLCQLRADLVTELHTTRFLTSIGGARALLYPASIVYDRLDPTVQRNTVLFRPGRDSFGAPLRALPVQMLLLSRKEDKTKEETAPKSERREENRVKFAERQTQARHEIKPPDSGIGLSPFSNACSPTS